MNPLQKQITLAAKSKCRLWLLNLFLLRTVPFNKPHNIKLVAIAEDGTLTVAANNTKLNRNHIKGIHACLLATLCEYVSGLCLLAKLDPKEYRIILRSIKMEYHYQAKSPVTATHYISDHYISDKILSPLASESAVLCAFEIKVWDKDKNHICTGNIEWQIKPWKKVKTIV